MSGRIEKGKRRQRRAELVDLALDWAWPVGSQPVTFLDDDGSSIPVFRADDGRLVAYVAVPICDCTD